MAGKKRGWGGPLLLRHDFLLDVLHENSFLLIGLLCGLGDLSTGGGLLIDGLDDADGHGLPHVTHGEATWEEKRRMRRERNGS